MSYVDVKVTTWIRYEIDAPLAEIKQELSKNWKHYLENVEIADACELDDGQDMMTPEENDNQCTVELYRKRGENPIWDNVRGDLE